MKTKIIRGCPIYLFRNTQYIEQPKGTIIRSMDYDKENNITYVKCKRPLHLFEFVVIMIMLLLTYYNISNNWGIGSVSIKYNSLGYYYNNKIYINLYIEKSSYELEYKLYTEDSILAEGYMKEDEYLINVDSSKYIEKVFLDIIVKTPIGKTIKETYKINVINKEINYE